MSKHYWDEGADGVGDCLVREGVWTFVGEWAWTNLLSIIIIPAGEGHTGNKGH